MKAKTNKLGILCVFIFLIVFAFTAQANATEIIEGHDHQYGEPDWTWAEDGTSATAAFTCFDCGFVETVEATTERYDWSDPACQYDGYSSYRAYVMFHDNQYTDTKEIGIPKTGHHYSDPEWSWDIPEYMFQDWRDYSDAQLTQQASAYISSTCEGCHDEQWVKGQITGTIIRGSCTKDGKIVYTAKADLKGMEYTDVKTFTLSACGHSWEYDADPKWEWSKDYKAATAIVGCENCSETMRIKATVDYEKEEPGCDYPGQHIYSAAAEYTDNQYGGNWYYRDEKCVNIPATGHHYKDNWEWDIDDYVIGEWYDYSDEELCDAAYVWADISCVNCDEGTYGYATVNAKVTRGTYTSNGKIVYTATLPYEGKTYTSTKTVTLSKLPLKSNSITVKTNITKTISKKAQSFSLNAKAKGGKLTYKSNNKNVTVNKNGKVTIPKNYCGIAKIKITAGSDQYKTVSKTVAVKVNPSTTTLSSVKKSGNNLKVSWKKNTTGTGYQVQYSTSKNFKKGSKTVTISKAKTTSTILKKLSKGTTYYVRVRTVKNVSGVKLYSAWSSVKSTKTSGRKPAASSSAATKNNQMSQANTVYVTPNGTKYHRSSCSTIKRSKNVRSVSRSNAERQGYDACKVCKP